VLLTLIASVAGRPRRRSILAFSDFSTGLAVWTDDVANLTAGRRFACLAAWLRGSIYPGPVTVTVDDNPDRTAATNGGHPCMAMFNFGFQLALLASVVLGGPILTWARAVHPQLQDGNPISSHGACRGTPRAVTENFSRFCARAARIGALGVDCARWQDEPHPGQAPGRPCDCSRGEQSGASLYYT